MFRLYTRPAVGARFWQSGAAAQLQRGFSGQGHDIICGRVQAAIKEVRPLEEAASLPATMRRAARS